MAKTHASFDDPNLVSHAGLMPAMALAQRAGLGGLIAAQVRPGGECGVNAAVKVPCLVAGMAAGAGSIDDMNLLRHGAMSTLSGGIRAPSTLGSHLRRDLITVAARTARHGRGHLTLHPPEGWHREHELVTILARACGPLAAAA